MRTPKRPRTTSRLLTQLPALLGKDWRRGNTASIGILDNNVKQGATGAARTPSGNVKGYVAAAGDGNAGRLKILLPGCFSKNKGCGRQGCDSEMRIAAGTEKNPGAKLF